MSAAWIQSDTFSNRIYVIDITHASSSQKNKKKDITHASLNLKRKIFP